MILLCIVFYVALRRYSASGHTIIVRRLLLFANCETQNIVTCWVAIFAIPLPQCPISHSICPSLREDILSIQLVFPLYKQLCSNMRNWDQIPLNTLLQPTEAPAPVVQSLQTFPMYLPEVTEQELGLNRRQNGKKPLSTSLKLRLLCFLSNKARRRQKS